MNPLIIKLFLASTYQMTGIPRKKGKRYNKLIFLSGILLGIILIFAGNTAVVKTSTNEFCAACHVHPQATQTWKRSTHVDNQRGVLVNCVDCHLPPKGHGYLKEKAITGIRDVWGKITKDVESLNWEEKSHLEYAKDHVYELSCIGCHQNNFPLGLSVEGKEAHLYYEQHASELHCINCHIAVGHYSQDQIHAKNVDFGMSVTVDKQVYTEPGIIDGLNDFTEFIPDTKVSFEMVAIPGGTYLMGSPETEPLRSADEGPRLEVKVSSFFMGRMEVSWEEYLAFFKQTGVQGKTSDAYLNVKQAGEVDAISGPTPPWGAPDQGWGKGTMPAMSMTHHAVEVYCQWLSKVTDKKYRLPTEAEWEYAARGGTETPYYFEGDPAKYTKRGLIRKIFGVDTTNISSNVNYRLNSMGKSTLPGHTQRNPFGLVHMLGNVAEFCADWYAADAYEMYPAGRVDNPTGPAKGAEYVVRGGSYKDEADRVRSAARNYTKTDSWLKTDPQIPKSIWWYSDCFYVGFRVVCEFDE